MFQTGELQKYNLNSNGSFVGLVSYNPHADFKKNYARPISRNGVVEVLSIGRANYAALDEFITQSLTAYYQSIETKRKQDEKNRMLAEYQQLYYLWQTIYTAKQNQDIHLNAYYDDIIYRLYLLGYKKV